MKRFVVAAVLLAGCQTEEPSSTAVDDLTTPTGLTGTGFTAGKTAYNLTANDQNEVPLSLYRYYGNYVVLDFCALWCSACTYAEWNNNEAAYDLYGLFRYPVFTELAALVEGGFPTLPSTQGSARAFADNFLLPEVLHADGVHGTQLESQFNSYDGTAYPTLVLLAPSMRIIKVNVGYMQATDIDSLIENDFLSHPVDATLACEKRLERAAFPSNISAPLADTLSRALTALDAGKTGAARGQLTSFQDQLTTDVAAGTVDRFKAQGLIDHAGWILRSLSAHAGCALPQSTCNETCMDLQSDNANCGACGNVCATGSTCQQGACTCPDGSASCNGTCPDYSSDANNCGACGNACPAGQVCNRGECGCPDGDKLCNGQCGVDFTSDPNNCGGCGNVCTNGATCQNLSCMCADGSTQCNGQCGIDTATDSNNCGFCGFTCPSGSTCQQSNCACSDGSEMCGGQCDVDYMNDPFNCGSCFNFCDSGICQSGQCLLF